MNHIIILSKYRTIWDLETLHAWVRSVTSVLLEGNQFHSRYQTFIYSNDIYSRNRFAYMRGHEIDM